MIARLRPFFRLAASAFLAAFACPRGAGQVVVAKQHYFFQTDANTVQEDPENGPLMFLTQVAGAVANINYQVTPPGASAVTLQNFAGNGGTSGPASTAQYQVLFPTQAALDAAFPDGGYGFSTGAVTATAATGGTYPDAVPTDFLAVQPPPTMAVTGGAQWTNGVLVWDTTYNLTLTVHYPGAFVPGSSLLEATFFVPPVNFSTTPEYNYGTTSFEQSNAPGLNSDTLTIKLIHGSMSPFKVFEVTITAQALGSYTADGDLPGGLIAGSHESRTSFFLEYDSYQGRPVRLTQQPPAGLRVGVGDVLTIPGGADGDPAPAYQWFHGQTKLAGATSATLSYTVQAGDDNTYVYYTATNKLGQTRSNLCPMRVFNGPPVLVAQPPASQTLLQGATTKLTAAPNGSPTDFTYQWYKDGVAITGANAATLTLTNVQPADAGTYYSIVSSPGGSTTSTSTIVKVTVPTTGPTGPPQFLGTALNSQLIGAGTSTVFTARAINAQGATYQWYFNGVAIPGTNSPQLLLFKVSAANVGSYTCTASNAVGSATTNPATLAITTGPFSTDPGRLINLSVLSTAPASGSPFTVGFLVGGANTQGNENVLIRATGPALVAPPFSQSGTLVDPVLGVFANSAAIATNDNWGTNQSAVVAAEASTFAFTLSDPSSLDAALTQTLGGGQYSVQITGKGAGGLALGEIYDIPPAAGHSVTAPRLINLSCINAVPAKGVLTAGFVLGGTGPGVLLIRGIGPALGPLGVSNVMSDPTITMYGTISGQQAIQGTNGGWGGDTTLTAACNAVQAFLPADPASHDAMLLTTQLPGSYSVQLTSVSGAAGQALIEVYEIP